MATREIWRSGLSVAWSKATCHRFNSDTNPSAQNGGARPQPFPDQVSGSQSDRDGGDSQHRDWHLWHGNPGFRVTLPAGAAALLGQARDRRTLADDHVAATLPPSRGPPWPAPPRCALVRLSTVPGGRRSLSQAPGPGAACTRHRIRPGPRAPPAAARREQQLTAFYSS